MGCENCYNNCSEIHSDKCIKYTGIDIPILGIKSGDSLSYVEQAIIEFLVPTLDGSGIVPILDPDIICTIVAGYLPTCGDITIVDIVSALIKTSCDLQEQITTIKASIDTLEASYDLGCFTSLAEGADTHVVVQALITKICAVAEELSGLVLDLETNYVQSSDLNNLIDEHLSGTSSLISNKMIPWVAVEYYGSLSYFDMTGKGIGEWDKIYLCNGNNGTPDKRGRVPVGATVGVGGPAFASAVDPTLPGNPSYALQTVGGSNSIALTGSQIPAHSHATNVTVTENAHFHYMYNSDAGGVSGATITPLLYPNFRHDLESGLSYRITGTTTIPTYGKSSPDKTNVSVTVGVENTGGNLTHSNIQPVLACYYIIYIP